MFELLAKKASSNPDHGDTDSRDVANAHEDEHDGLLASVGCTDVDGGETGDGHGRHAAEERIDEFDVILTIAGIEDTSSDERGKGKDKDVNSEEVEVLAAPSTCRAQLGTCDGGRPTGSHALQHDGVCRLN